MRKPVSVLLAASLCIGSVNSWDGTCTANANESKVDDEFCKQLDHPVRCDANGRCSWSDSTELADAKRQQLLQKSRTAVNVKNNRLTKDLLPIEAVTEYVGDYLMYRLLENIPVMKEEYQGVLSHYFGHMRGHMPGVFNIAKSSDYHPLKNVLESWAIRDNEYPTDSKLLDLLTKSKKNPIPIVLQYSRVFLNDVVRWKARLEPGGLALGTFTLNGLVSNVIICFADFWDLNNDRYHPLYSVAKKGPNTGNMMIKKDQDGKWIYVPIDQGFARSLTAPWVDWLQYEGNDPKIDRELTKFGVENVYNYKQLIYSPIWLEIKDPNPKKSTPPRSDGGDKWLKSYVAWLSDPDWTTKAKQFLEDNAAFFPAELQARDDLKQKAIKIVEAVWRAMGPDLCIKLHNIKEHIFHEINHNNPNVLSMIKGMRSDTKAAWRLVQNAIKKQDKACRAWATEMEKDEDWQSKESEAANHWEYIKRQMHHAPLFTDFTPPEVSDQIVSAGVLQDRQRRRSSTLTQLRAKDKEDVDTGMGMGMGASAISGVHIHPKTGTGPHASGIVEEEEPKTGTGTQTKKALKAPYGDALYEDMESGDGPRMKQDSLYYDYDAKAAQYLWMALMTAIIACGCLMIYFVSCILSGLFFEMVCVEKLIKVFPWLKKKRAVLCEDDEDVLSV